MLNNIIHFFINNKLVSFLLFILIIGWGLMVAPFDFGIEGLPRDPVAVDAIPDIGENQQIVFTKWDGQSPQDIEDQVTYPLMSSLLGIPGVKTIRSSSMFGVSSIYVIFEEDIEFYWSRSRILEKLNSLPSGLLPNGVQPTLGPDATALGQIYWYTLEGRDEEGNVTGGWDLQELRSIQDYYVKYGLASAKGVSEVASIGGFIKEYQIDVDPLKLQQYNLSLQDITNAVKSSNKEIGAKTLEINRVEYFVRGLGYIKKIEDLENSVIKAVNNAPILLKDVAKIMLGPVDRRGILDKNGAEVVGGVIVARYGANPMAVIDKVKEKIKEISSGLPTKTLKDGRVSHLTIVPFYDRTKLIKETLFTLNDALILEILVTILVIMLMLFNLRSSILISGLLPIAVLMVFIAMKMFGVDANIVALSGIAIAIGTMVDMGIVLIESMVNRIKEATPEESLLTSIYEATTEVASAVITAVATTVISFIPVFTMEASEGKLFRPLAYTKTFALIASIIVAITIIPPLAHSLFSFKSRSQILTTIANGLAIVGGLVLALFYQPLLGSVLMIVGIAGLLTMLAQKRGSNLGKQVITWIANICYALIVAWLLATIWMPLGVTKSNITNFLFVVLVAGSLIGFFYLIIYFYESILRFLLRFKILFLLLVGFIVFQGVIAFQQTGEEFMPSLDEGSFLLMPTSMPHAGMQENIKNLRLLDMAVTAIPEVESVVGKAGRVNSALDPAPMSMYENIIQYKTEYKTDQAGHRIRYKMNEGKYVRNKKGDLVEAKDGQFFRQWREHIHSPDDIWKEIVKVTKLPGVTSAPKLQPIETRLVMLQTGMRAPMGIKVSGSDLAEIEQFGLALEKELKNVEGVKKAAVFADRIVGKPYLLLDIDRQAISRYGMTIAKVQQYIQVAVGGMAMTETVEGRERYAIRIRYPRELRADPEALKRIYIPTAKGQQIPLGDLVTIRYESGAQSIKSEDGFLIGYVLFDKEEGYSEVDVVKKAQAHFKNKIEQGDLVIPAGINYRFAGNYEQQVRASKRLSLVVPISLLIIFLILYFQFKSVMISLMVFTGVFIAFAGGFIMIGLYGTDWFLDFNFLGANMRDLFQIRTINLSVAVWVGFLALFGIATDDGVLVATFLQASFKKHQPESLAAIRNAVVEGGKRRVRPAMMTTATTVLALLPVLTSTGRGSDVMLPMAIPSFGGMTLQMITMFTVPVLFSLWQEWKLKYTRRFGQKNIKQMKTLSIGLVLVMLGFAANAQTLKTLEAEAISNNLGIKVLESEYQAALERAPQVSQLPDPEVGIGGYPLPVETRLGPQYTRFSATQTFPWKGTLQQKAAVEEAKAQTLLPRIDSRTLGIRYQIQSAYLQLFEIQQSQSIIQRRMDILKTLERLALAKVESGRASMADVLRVQLKIEALLQEDKILTTRKIMPTATINQLLNRPTNTVIAVTDSFAFAKMTETKESILSKVKANHPVLERYDLQQEVANQQIALNKKNGRPSFGVGIDYMLLGSRTDADPIHNGRDILQLRAAMKIPLNRKKYEAKEREEQLKIIALDHQKADTYSQFVAAIEQAFAKHQIAEQQIQLYQKQQGITQTAIQILEGAYSASGKNFDELLQLEAERIAYDFKILKAVVNSHLALFSIQRLIRN